MIAVERMYKLSSFCLQRLGNSVSVLATASGFVLLFAFFEFFSLVVCINSLNALPITFEILTASSMNMATFTVVAQCSISFWWCRQQVPLKRHRRRQCSSVLLTFRFSLFQNCSYPTLYLKLKTSGFSFLPVTYFFLKSRAHV